jgi:hypothetical protein
LNKVDLPATFGGSLAAGRRAAATRPRLHTSLKAGCPGDLWRILWQWFSELPCFSVCRTETRETPNHAEKARK